MTSRDKRKSAGGMWCGATVATAVIVALRFCSVHGVWSRDEWLVYQIMAEECHPAWMDYHFGRVNAGDDVELVIARTKPSIVTRTGNHVTLEYYQNYQAGGGLHFTGLHAEARHGKLVYAYAHSCDWTRQFFDTDGKEEDFFAFEYRRLPQGGAISSIYGY